MPSGKTVVGKKRKSFETIASRVAGVVSASRRKALDTQRLEDALKRSAKQNSRLASIVGELWPGAEDFDKAGQRNVPTSDELSVENECPICSNFMWYDDSSDAFTCTCGYVASNRPASASIHWGDDGC